MASLQQKGDGWYCQFLHKKRRYTFALGRVNEAEARAVAAKVDYVLMRLKQRLLDIPAGMDVTTFVRHGGHPPAAAGAEDVQKRSATLAAVRDAYLAAVGGGAVEVNTLATARIHLKHLTKTLGADFPADALSLADLQRHVTRRQKAVAGVTIKKEIDTAKGVWNWAKGMGLVANEFPAGKLLYPKADEKLPFMTWTEAERRVAAGADPTAVWECLYLTADELAELLAFVAGRPAPGWVYPMVLAACHTGARRGELLRATGEDLDLAAGVLTLREKKRVRGTRTTRRVPLSGPLRAELTRWQADRVNRPYLFGLDGEPLAVQTAQKAFVRVLRGSKWSVLKGWHVLRHSFISALASRGIDQRLIDEFVGHQSEAMRRRYRHLYPSTQEEAIRLVFGG